jgi:hypothetical protein
VRLPWSGEQKAKAIANREKRRKLVASQVPAIDDGAVAALPAPTASTD